MNSVQLSVVHRLPQNYRWLSGFTGVKVEPTAQSGSNEGNHLIGLKLLSPDGLDAEQVMQQLKLSLQTIKIDCAVVEWEGEPCLFVHCRDESAALCRLKDIGAAIAEQISEIYPF
ncbi:YejG family protein [Serratia sp. DD3]|uniref:YejG family protein n=1 Tax=Serratia sp. DD3 TaxID=1410619 RepID=UPI0003C5299A|nr:YejG family protein [Serratia sp. DD3]KEY59023.1 hypothetical protein SRDD_19700 [Serratia sp. DD3]